MTKKKEDKTANILVVIDGKNYTLVEAKALYKQLHDLFGDKKTAADNFRDLFPLTPADPWRGPYRSPGIPQYPFETPLLPMGPVITYGAGTDPMHLRRSACTAKLTLN